MCCDSWGHKELDTTERLNLNLNHFYLVDGKFGVQGPDVRIHGFWIANSKADLQVIPESKFYI